jgi:RES domain-containing protein
MRDLRAFFRTAQVSGFKGTVYRICPARFAGNLVSMRGSLLYGARYNVRGYFGALYTSLSEATAQAEIARYFTVSPREGFVMAAIGLRLSRVVDLTDRKLLRKPQIRSASLIEAQLLVTHEIGMRAWESGTEALLVPSAANPAEKNLAVFLDNQQPQWHVELAEVVRVPLA